MTFPGPIEFFGDHLEGFSDSNVTHIRPSDFTNPRIVNVLTSEFVNHFENLRDFQLMNMSLRQIQPNAFEICNLSSLNANSNRELTNLPPHVFRNCRNLVSLSLGTCGFREIHLNYFTGLENLEELVLWENFLERIDTNILMHLSKLRSLHLARNFLRTLDANFFIYNPFLWYLNFDVNRNIQIHPQAFRGLSNLNFLSIENCNLTQINPEIFNGLTSLGSLLFDFNRITRLDSFPLLPRLSWFRISHNQLNAIQPNFFNSLPYLRTFDAWENVCIDRANINIPSVDLNATFGRCFENWREITTTTERTTVTISTTTSTTSITQPTTTTTTPAPTEATPNGGKRNSHFFEVLIFVTAFINLKLF